MAPLPAWPGRVGAGQGMMAHVGGEYLLLPWLLEENAQAYPLVSAKLLRVLCSPP